MSTCRQQSCCDFGDDNNPNNYRSDSEPGTNVPVNGGCVVPVVQIDPPDGAYVIFPTLVGLKTNVAGAVIYYTIDGTEPAITSTPYTVPFTVTGQNVTVKARAFIEGCDPGPVATAMYQVISLPQCLEFSYLCETGDQVGVFHEFAANGNANDYQFILRGNCNALSSLASLTILQTDASGFWNSGQSWSTREWIYPFPDPAIPFHTYPLVVISQTGPTQLNSAYTEAFGDFPLGVFDWRMWGQPASPLGGYFKLIIVLTNGNVIQQIISTTCVPPPPPPCGPTQALTTVADCTPKVTISATLSGVKTWRIFRRTQSPCGSGSWSQLTNGVTAVDGLVSYVDTGVQKCCSYGYYIDVLCVDSGNYIPGAITTDILVPCQCVISASVTPASICLGQSATLTWEALNCATFLLNGGAVDGTGTLVVSPAVDTNYTFEGTSAGCPAPAPVVRTVTVKLPPTLGEVTVDPLTGCVGDTVTVYWEFTGTEPMTITVDGVAVGSGASGSVERVLTSAPQTFTVVATNECGSDSGSATVGAGSCGCFAPADVSGCACMTAPDSVVVTWTDELSVSHSVLLINRGSKQAAADAPCVGCGGKYYTSTINYSLVNSGDVQWPDRLELIAVAVGINRCATPNPCEPTAAWIVAGTNPSGGTWTRGKLGKSSPSGSYPLNSNLSSGCGVSRASNVTVS